MTKKEARKALNCSQSELAELLGVSTKYLDGLKVLSDFHIRLVQAELERRVLTDKNKRLVAMALDYAADMENLLATRD